MNTSTRLTSAMFKATASFGLTALLIAGCASSKSTPAAAPATSAAAPAAATTSNAAAAPAAPAVVDVKTGPLGAYLTDANGRTLYLFNDDKGTTSACTGKCATAWPPLLTGGAPQTGAGATASQLATSQRADGSMQVTYSGHPLYYFAADKTAGDMNGQGKGGTWWLVAPAGTQVGAAPAAGATPTPTMAKTSSAAAGGGWS